MIWLIQKPVIVIPISLALVVLGISPLVARVILKRQGIYHVQITVLDQSGQPTSDGQISASTGILLKKEPLNWEADIAPQALPSDGKVTFIATVKNSYLAGEQTIKVGNDYFPRVTILLKPLPPVLIRGVIELPNGRSVPGARVSVLGYSDHTVSDQMGNFEMASHAADGEMITIRAEKGDLQGQYSGPAGKPFTIILGKQ